MSQNYLENAYNYLLKINERSGNNVIVMEEPNTGEIETATVSEVNEDNIKMLRDEITARKNEKRVVITVNGEDIVTLER